MTSLATKRRTVSMISRRTSSSVGPAVNGEGDMAENRTFLWC